MKADANKSIEQLSELSQAVLNGWVRYNEIISGRLEQFLKLHNAVINDSLESGIQYIRSLSEVKKPEDAISSQINYLNEASRKAADNARKYLNLLMETNAEVNSALQQNIEQLNARTGAKKAA